MRRAGVRNATQVMFGDETLATQLFERPPGWRASGTSCGANERLRCYRSEAGQFFAPHFDGAFTLLVCLNACEAGATRPSSSSSGASRPFNHFLPHQGAPVEPGLEYVLRSDLMYRRDAAARG